MIYADIGGDPSTLVVGRIDGNGIHRDIGQSGRAVHPGRAAIFGSVYQSATDLLKRHPEPHGVARVKRNTADVARGRRGHLHLPPARARPCDLQNPAGARTDDKGVRIEGSHCRGVLPGEETKGNARPGARAGPGEHQRLASNSHGRTRDFHWRVKQ